MSAVLTTDQLRRDRALRDLTDPTEGPHAIQLIIHRAVAALAGLWDCEVRWSRGERIVSIQDNYDDLGFDRADITRDTRYTRYIDAHRMLRSHSSAMIPPALRTLVTNPATDVLLVCPGMVYRRDAIDRLHTATPHQLDLWRITRRTPPMSDTDLSEMISTFVGALLPGATDRRQPRSHPYTLGGLQVDISRDGQWVEIAECGLAHPDVLVRAGLASSYSGLALGMGLDRLLMLLKAIPDIRLLRATDPAITSQMTDLSPYRSVSVMPPIRRDISVVVDSDDLIEDLGDRVRGALGEDAACVESVDILQQTPCSALPAPALGRLGARRDQKNLLIRVVLRHVDKTLLNQEANVLRDRIYAALHQGTTQQWATITPAPT